MTEKEIYTLENIINVTKEEYWMFSEKNREKSFKDWPFDDSAACNPKTVPFVYVKIAFVRPCRCPENA